MKISNKKIRMLRNHKRLPSEIEFRDCLWGVFDEYGLAYRYSEKVNLLKSLSDEMYEYEYDSGRYIMLQERRKEIINDIEECRQVIIQIHEINNNGRIEISEQEKIINSFMEEYCFALKNGSWESTVDNESL